jgi:hypothetical protein
MFDAKAKAAMLSMALLLAGTAFMVQPASAASFDNIQVFANPISSEAHSFQFTAYNLSGSLVASYQSPYPAAAFELPSGGYLFTVSATDYVSRVGYACPLMQGGAKLGAVSPPTQPTGSNSKAIFPWCYPPSSEYGYTVTSVTGPQTITIDLANASTLPTTPVTVKVTYVNGTAAEGAYVYASVVGEWYYWWWYDSASINMSGQTDANGIAHLVVPVAPTVITAWKWVPVFAGNDGTATKVDVGGQEVNVTAYWEPAYVGLSGSGLLLPPHDSVAITLHYQQPDYWVMPAGVAMEGAALGAAPAAALANQPGGTPALVSNSQNSSQGYLPAQIPSIQEAAASPSGTQNNILSVQTLGLTAIFIIAAAAAIIVAVKRHSAKPSAQTG